MGIVHSKNYSITKKLFNKIFIQKIWKLFIQKNYSFFWKIYYRPGLLVEPFCWCHQSLPFSSFIFLTKITFGKKEATYMCVSWFVRFLSQYPVCSLFVRLCVGVPRPALCGGRGRGREAGLALQLVIIVNIIINKHHQHHDSPYIQKANKLAVTVFQP